MDRYFGNYQKFNAVSEKEAGYLLNADNLVGDRFEIEIVFEEGVRTAWLVNKFGKRIGSFNEQFSRQLGLMEAKEWVLSAYLSYIAYTEAENGGFYWGEMAVVCFNRSIEQPVREFASWLSSQLQNDVRPRIDLDFPAVSKLVESNGAWKPEQTLPLLTPEKGSVIMKRRLSFGDKMIEQGRKGSAGCYIASWIFVLSLVLLVVLGLSIFFR